MTTIPAAVIILRKTFFYHMRVDNQFGYVHKALLRRAHAQLKLVIFHRADAVFHALQLRMKEADVFEDGSTHGEISGDESRAFMNVQLQWLLAEIEESE